MSIEEMSIGLQAHFPDNYPIFELAYHATEEFVREAIRHDLYL